MRTGIRGLLFAAGSMVGLMATGCAALPESTESSDPQESLGENTAAVSYTQDFFDGFDGAGLDYNNWVDQLVWVNNELQCYDNTYNEGGGHKTMEVSYSAAAGSGSLKVRVVDSGTVSGCSNKDKNGATHPNTQYKGGRIATKSKREFMGGKWTARLKFYTWTKSNATGQPSGLAGMFPAWWVLGARNNEAPITNSGYQNVCWPLRGSGEVDIMEHYGNNGTQNVFAARGIKSTGGCNNGDWQTYQVNIGTDFNQFHEYQAEFLTGGDIVYRIDNVEKARSYGIGFDYPEPMFGILNYAIQQPMNSSYKEYAMEVDWVKHESVSGGCGIGNNVAINAYNGYNYASAQAGDVLTATSGTVQGWEQYDIVDAGGGYVALRSHKNNNYVSTRIGTGDTQQLQATATSIQGWEKYQFVSVGGGYYGLKAAANNLYVSTDSNNGSKLRAAWATSVGDWEKFSCVRY